MGEMEEKIRSMDLIQEEMMRAESGIRKDIVMIKSNLDKLEGKERCAAPAGAENLSPDADVRNIDEKLPGVAGPMPALVIAGDAPQIVDDHEDDKDEVFMGIIAGPDVDDESGEAGDCECEVDYEDPEERHELHLENPRMDDEAFKFKIVNIAMEEFRELEPWFKNREDPNVQKASEKIWQLIHSLYDRKKSLGQKILQSDQGQSRFAKLLAECVLETMKMSVEDEPPDPEPLDKKSKWWTELEDDL